MQKLAPTSTQVGEFIDEIVFRDVNYIGKRRTAAAVSGRLIEEVTELCLVAGLTAGEIMAHVVDSLHNQSLKASKNAGNTIFPSEIVGVDTGFLSDECADVGLILKDLSHIGMVDQESAMAIKWDAFTKKQFKVGAKGTVYAVKPHIKVAAPKPVMGDIETRVKKCVDSILRVGIDKIDSNKDLAHLGADSLDLTEVAVALEEEFNCKVNEAEIAKLMTVGEMIEFIKLNT